MPVSALIALRRSVGRCRVTETGAPLLYVIPLFAVVPPAGPIPTSPVHLCTRRHRPSVTAAPNLNEWDPVTYDTDPDSVNNFEKWSAGLGHAEAYTPVL